MAAPRISPPVSAPCAIARRTRGSKRWCPTSAADVLNHNLETVPRLYREARPGADYAHSLELLRAFKASRPHCLTKSGLMLGLGETDDEVVGVMRDLRRHGVDMLTVGQYLQPRAGNLPVRRYVTPAAFVALEGVARRLGFANVASGPLVRSSYHADRQALAAGAP
jgi:lipoic acid synthetase